MACNAFSLLDGYGLPKGPNSILEMLRVNIVQSVSKMYPRVSAKPGCCEVQLGADMQEAFVDALPEVRYIIQYLVHTVRS